MDLISFQMLNCLACFVGALASFAIADECSKRRFWKGRIAYMILAGAYLCNAWNMLAVKYPFVPWTAVFVHATNAAILSGAFWHTRRGSKFFWK